jgi:ABC-type multidrug transport system ATPase subunit
VGTNWIVEGRSICHHYGNQVALSDLHLTVKRGEIVGLFGANGAGKTTTLKILSGLLKPTGGTVSVLGQPVLKTLSRAGVVPENPAFYLNMTAMANLDIACSYAGRTLTKSELKAQLSRVGLGSQSGTVKNFSLGMRRRLALAVALAKEPDLLLLDEPTNGLDIEGVELFRNLLRQHIGQGRACVLSTHNWDEAERLVTGVVILNQGKTLYNGPVAELVSPGDRWKVACADQRAGNVLRAIPGVSVVSDSGTGEFVVDLHKTPIAAVTQRLSDSGCPPEMVTPFHQPLSEVYRSLVKGGVE